MCATEFRVETEDFVRGAQHGVFSAPRQYKDVSYLKKSFWWSDMKNDIVDFVSRCLICQQVKAEHQRPSGLLHLLSIPE